MLMTVPQIWRRMTGSNRHPGGLCQAKHQGGETVIFLNQATEMESKGASKLRELICLKSALFWVVGDPTGIALVNGHSYNGIRQIVVSRSLVGNEEI